MRRFFLASPLKFQPVVTSGFSRSRLHPILSEVRAHLGVDYRAPRARRSSRSPTASSVGRHERRRGPDGASPARQRLRDASICTSRSIAVRAGAHVRQGELIGRVGSSGLATGPHLDYRLKKNGAFINPVTAHRAMPPADPIPAGRWRPSPRARDRAFAKSSARMSPSSAAPTALARAPRNERARPAPGADAANERYNLSPMATLHPFRALRPTTADASADRRRSLRRRQHRRGARAGGGQSAELSARLARRDRAAAGTDPYADAVYERAAANFDDAARSRWSSKTSPACTSTACGWATTRRPAWPPASPSTNTTATSSRSTSGRGATRKTIAPRHMLALGAQTGPVFLTYRAAADDRPHRGEGARPARRSSTSRRPTTCAIRCGGSTAPTATRWSRRSGASRRSTSPTAIIARRAPRGRARRCATRERAARRSATAPTTRRCWRSRSRTTRCRSCRTTGS